MIFSHPEGDRDYREDESLADAETRWNLPVTHAADLALGRLPPDRRRPPVRRSRGARTACAFEGYYWRFAEPGWSVARDRGRLPRRARDLGDGHARPPQPGGCRAHRDRRARLDRSGRPRRRRRPAAARRRATRCAVDLGPGLNARFDARRDWPRRPWGPLGPAQLLPWLGQYWAPHLLGARVTGALRRRARWTARTVYAEKNWGAAFADALVVGPGGVRGALASPSPGGRVHGVAPTAVAAWTPDEVVTLAPPFARTVARAGGGEWRIRRELAALAGRDRGRGARARC